MKQPLITILTAPKPFVDPHIELIQRNALLSWKALGDAVDVIVLGDDEGIKEYMQKMHVRHFPGVRCNEKGTPIISSMLEIGRKESTAPMISIVNADIILFPDFVNAVRKISKLKDQFLLIGQRWDMDVAEEVGSHPEDFVQLKDQIETTGRLHPPRGSDYFVFPRGCYQSIPDFAIGRAGWDNWFIYKSRWEGWPVIDGTHDVTIVHQSHDYAHLPDGKPHYRLPETKQNVAMGGGEHTIYSLFDAEYDLKDGHLRKKKSTWKKFFREIEIFPMVKKRSQFFGKVFFYIFHPKKAYASLRRVLNR